MNHTPVCSFFVCLFFWHEVLMVCVELTAEMCSVWAWYDVLWACRPSRPRRRPSRPGAGRRERPNRPGADQGGLAGPAGPTGLLWVPGAQCCAVPHGSMIAPGSSTQPSQTTCAVGWPGLTGIDSHSFPSKRSDQCGEEVFWTKEAFIRGKNRVDTPPSSPGRLFVGSFAVTGRLLMPLLSSSDTTNHRWDSENIKGKRSRKIPQRD